MNSGRSLELFFVDGNPDGMLTAEVFNWTGHVLRVPRTRLADGLKRAAARQTGVYILTGEDDEGPLAYIGEAENMAVRLRQHASQKDWWDSAVMITTAGDALHKAHVKYLESRLVETAIDAGITRLENGNVPPKTSLNEAATANMESFLETLNMVLPAIRVDMLQSRKRAIAQETMKSAQPIDQVEFEFLVKRHNVHAKAIFLNGEMVVLKGSSVRPIWVGDKKHNTHYWKLHDILVASGTIHVENGVGALTQDYAFSSPSAAAAIVSGRSANGRTSWRRPNGQTYAEWEEQQLSEAAE